MTEAPPDLHVIHMENLNLTAAGLNGRVWRALSAAGYAITADNDKALLPPGKLPALTRFVLPDCVLYSVHRVEQNQLAGYIVLRPLAPALTQVCIARAGQASELDASLLAFWGGLRSLCGLDHPGLTQSVIAIADLRLPRPLVA